MFGNFAVNIPALWSEVLYSCVGLVGGENGNLLTIRTFGGGDDFILCRGGRQIQDRVLEELREDQKQRLSIPVVSLSDFSQSRMTKDGHPSTVTTVTLDGGERGGEVTFTSPGSSSGK